MIEPPAHGWPCPACGRDRVGEDCPCGESGPLRVERIGGVLHRTVRWSNAAGRGQAHVGWGGGLSGITGVGLVRRSWSGPDWGRFRAGSEHLTGERLDPDWWNAVHLRDGVVLGVPTPTQARLAFAICTAIIGCLARGHLWAVVDDRREWWREGGARSERIVRAGGGCRFARRRTATREADLEGLVLKALSDEPQRLDEVLSIDDHDRWMGHALGRPDPAVLDAWQTWIAEAPWVSARMVQEALIGVGAMRS